ncbi:hypothetical protein BH09BAC5_BH09BAC5_20280 [soil metagenome]
MYASVFSMSTIEMRKEHLPNCTEGIPGQHLFEIINNYKI